ncbi:MAG TPA: hypothetical protein VLZ05_24980 [Mycobacterium sp.]|nr:hypothetical protein [Mycobacterium sp.]HUH71843.1 hypothetical protein [Mycobacterium sp.]
MKMPSLAAIALQTAPIFGGALLGVAAGQFAGGDFRTGIKEDMELLDRLPEDEIDRRAALRRSIANRIDDLVVANEKRRQLRAAAIVYEGNWRDIVLFLCTALFTGVWWQVDHGRANWLPLFIALILASVVTAGYALRGARRSMLKLIHRAASHPGPTERP